MSVLIRFPAVDPHTVGVRRSLALPTAAAWRRLLMALGIAAVVIAEVGFIWMLGQTGDHFDGGCMAPPGCSR